MAYIITRKYCSDCGREISEAKKEIAMLKDRLVIERELCIWCINKRADFKRK